MDDYTFAAFEGLASGAMLVVVAGQYLPDAARQLGGEGEPLRAGVPGNTAAFLRTGVSADMGARAVKKIE